MEDSYWAFQRHKPVVVEMCGSLLPNYLTLTLLSLLSLEVRYTDNLA